jgi:hypothetical protein
MGVAVSSNKSTKKQLPILHTIFNNTGDGSANTNLDTLNKLLLHDINFIGVKNQLDTRSGQWNKSLECFNKIGAYDNYPDAGGRFRGYK